MKSYNITFVTNSEQSKPYSKTVNADNAKEAKLILRADTQIPARFILTCKAVK